jgi:hypothetical protein
MDQIRQQLRAPAAAVRTEQVLERYYGQLVEWGTLLTRGDEGKAQDLVHDFCLHFTVTRPDLSGVANLDGYSINPSATSISPVWPNLPARRCNS